MRYLVKQKLFSLSQGFDIKNENGDNVYKVKGRVFSLGKKLQIFDLYENELCYIEQKVFKLMPEYNIFSNGTHVANVKKKFAFFKNDFSITGKLSCYDIKGDFLAHEFSILSQGQTIAKVSKKFCSLTDTYGIEIYEKENEILLLALIIVIDMVCHENN